MSSIDSWSGFLDALLRPQALAELAVVALCLALAWAITRWIGPRNGQWAIVLGERGWDGVLFPLLALAAALVGRRLMAAQGEFPLVLMSLAVPVLASLVVIRLAVRVLRVAFPASGLVRALERSISWGVWLLLVLWITGVLPVLLHEADAMTWHIGGAPVSLRSLLEGALTAAAVLVLMLWLSSAIEARLLRASGVNMSVRKMAANATRAGLLLVGLLIALSAAGIPLGALGVLGGAVGVGIGFGLQKLASNYVSGFVILAERSLRIGDMVRVDGFEGRITDISTRYTVIRSVGGRESIVPNELLITQRVENLSFADTNVSMSSVVQVAYGTDLDALTPKLEAAMAAVPRVMAVPGPGVQLSAFASDGLELTLVFWIGDPENGQGNVRSAVNMAVLRALNEAGVEIPYPQRVVKLVAPPEVSPSV